jgi:Tol biopolymer transport system component/DNA-binding winged helix-turn-helix (wHTH) protein
VSDVKTRQGAYRFDKFELDLRAGELRQDDGKTLRLTEQPFQILLMLLERQGGVVTREELRKRLWPNDTIVEFEHSISAAMNRLRQALGDSANNPHYVETLARRGYRWMVPAEWRESLPPSPAVIAATEIKSTAENLIGRRVSHYRLLQILGGGGMGIVYEAEDLKLGRRVALKVLPEELATDPLALQRFEREAQAASALDHPNICTIHEFGEHEGKPFIVMQLLDGQTVREHIASAVPGKTLWPIDKLLDLAVQIADGLDVAHRRGIIHRDVKPANIFITKRGEVKILDFGVAKLTGMGEPVEGTIAPASEEMQRPSALGLTVTGRSVGTASYMSPEQVRGEKLDARTDLFSFGLVLFEMATTQRAFPGDTATRVHEAILQQQQVSPRQLNRDVPSKLEEIIHKCLEKGRETRYQTAAELLSDLKRLQRDVEPVGRVPKKRWAAAIVAAASLGVILAGGWRLLGNRAKALPPVKMVPLVTNSGIEGRPAFSPDGTQVAFMWNGGEGDQYDVYVKLIGDSAAPVRITRSPGAFAGWPVWSPDGHRIAFIRCSDTRGAIFVVQAIGGQDRKIAEPRFCPGIVDWSPDGRLLVFEDRDSAKEPNGIFLASVETGQQRRLTTPAKLEQDAEPKFSPDGKTVAFVRVHHVIVGDIFLVPVEGGEPKRLTSMNSSEVPGLAWTTDGSEIIFSATSREMGNKSLWRVKVHGGMPEKVAELGGVNAEEPAVSRQGHRLAYRTFTMNYNIWQIPLTNSNGRPSAPVKFISSTRYQDVPQYSPNGKKIAFASDRSGSSQIWVCDSDASNLVQLTVIDASNNGTPRWSPDGRTIVFDSTASGNLGLYTISADGGSPLPLVVDSHFNGAGSYSRDGRWIYFVSDRSGEYEVWKVPSGGGQPVQVTNHSGWMPMESTDGRVLYYVKTNLPTDPSNAPARLWAMPVGGGEEYPVTSQPFHLHWAVAPNGIYFTDPETKPLATLKFLDVRTGRISTIATLEKPLSGNGQSLSVSPDGRFILYSQLDSISAELMVVENFR